MESQCAQSSQPAPRLDAGHISIHHQATVDEIMVSRGTSRHLSHLKCTCLHVNGCTVAAARVEAAAAAAF